MTLAAAGLATLAVLLAWPVPLLLARSRWPGRAPATALLLWQTIALAGGLSMVGALLALGLAPFGDNLVAGLIEAPSHVASLEAAEVPALAAIASALLFGGYLLTQLVRTGVAVGRERRRHRRLVHLLSSPAPDDPHARILDAQTPVAYCLPGGGHSVTVFSAGLLHLLDEHELRAVVGHERAHLSQRHDMVLVAFEAWHRSLPWFPIASRSRREVASLVEMLADDHARRLVDDRTLARAITLVAGGAALTATSVGSADAPGTSAPPALLPHAHEQLEARVTRLTDDHRPLGVPARAAVLVTALALIAVPTVLLLEPALGL